MTQNVLDISKMTMDMSHPGRGESLGIKTKTITGLISEIKRGFSFTTVKRYQSQLGLDLKQVADAIQVNPRTLDRRKSEGKLHPGESERLLRHARIFELTVSLFENDTKEAIEWLNTPNLGLGDETPFEFAKTEIGAREVETLIVQLEHGVF